MNLKETGNLMIFCCDTSFLISLYSIDAHSAVAKKYVTLNSPLLSVTAFNCFELHQALRFSEFRKVLAPGKAELLLAAFEQDLEKEYHSKITCNLASVLVEAQRLATRYTIQEGYRSFDILHVAAALHLQADVFLTFDHKQKMLAKSEGLKTPL